MKTIKLTLAMVALALGATVFAFSGHTDPVKPVKETTYYYKNTGGGAYVQISSSQADPSLHCDEPDDNYCILQSSSNLGSFTLGVNAPGDITPANGSDRALYQ